MRVRNRLRAERRVLLSAGGSGSDPAPSTTAPSNAAPSNAARFVLQVRWPSRNVLLPETGPRARTAQVFALPRTRAGGAEVLLPVP